MNNYFKQAEFVSKKNAQDKAVQMLFSCELEGNAKTVKIAVSNNYRMTVNDVVVAYGPARAGHDFARVDVFDISEHLVKGKNRACIETVNNAVDSLAMANQAFFFCAEISDAEGNVLICTSENMANWTIKENKFRIWNGTLKMTHARGIAEVYDFSKQISEAETELANFVPKLLERRAPFADLTRIHEAKFVHGGYNRVIAFDDYTFDENRTVELLRLYEWDKDESVKNYSYSLFELDINTTGFIIAEFECLEDCEILIAHEEYLHSEVYLHSRKWWANDHLTIKMKKGQKVSLESIEPYACKYIAFFVMHGAAKVSGVKMRDYAYDERLFVKPELPEDSSQELKTVYNAAVETFRQNTIDLFMDCPGRERAPWLCDSFFTAKTAYMLTQNTLVEEDFIENYLLSEGFECLPEGLLPMCYPADISMNTIPQWSMWFMLQIDEYIQIRNGKRNFFLEFKDRFLAFEAYFDKFINEEGLLENLDGWSFIEWSEACKFIDGIHFPTNLLYAKCLEIFAKYFDDEKLMLKSQKMKQTSIEMAFDRQGLRDNAQRKDGKLIVNENFSEIAQYFALFFGACEPGSKEYLDLLQSLEYRTHPACETARISMFIGQILRLEILLQNKRYDTIKDESERIFLPMAKATGTLWESYTPRASCCHAFASFPAYAIYCSCQDKNI